MLALWSIDAQALAICVPLPCVPQTFVVGGLPSSITKVTASCTRAMISSCTRVISLLPSSDLIVH